MSKNIGDENLRGDKFKSFTKLWEFKATGFRVERVQWFTEYRGGGNQGWRKLEGARILEFCELELMKYSINVSQE